MRKSFAFAAAFCFTMAVMLVPLGIAGLPTTDPRPAPVAEAVPASYDYRIMPGLIPGPKRINPYLYLLHTVNTQSTVLLENDDGGAWEDSRIQSSLDKDTTYTIEATTAGDIKLGTFALVISTCSDSDDSDCPMITYQDRGCGRPVGVINLDRRVRVAGKWTSNCASQQRDGQYGKRYTFTLDDDMDVTIDLMGLADGASLAERLETVFPLPMTCGWHDRCTVEMYDDDKDVSNTANSGIDFRAGAGTPVYLVIKTLDGGQAIEAHPMFVTFVRYSPVCKRTNVQIRFRDSDDIIAVLKYVHTITLHELLMPDPILPSHVKNDTTITAIARVAEWPPGEESITEHPGCGTGTHLHQGMYDAYLGNTEAGWRNYDRDEDAKEQDDEGLPGHESDSLTCFWSDTWVHAIQRHPTDTPKPTDRSKHGPNDTPHCPLRFFGTIADQSWASGQAVSLTVPEAKGGNGSLTYSLQNCPHGLSIDSGNRVISGTPSSTASGTCKVVVNDQSSVPSTTLSFDYEVRGGGSPAPVRDTSPSFPSGTTIDEQRWTQNSAITAFTLPSAEGGNSPLSHSLNEDFPDDVDVGDNHRVSGTPKQAMARKAYTWTATDADNDTASITFFVTIAAEPTTEPPPPAPTYRLTVEASPSSCGDASGTGDYPEGRKAPIRASVKANVDCHFTGWTGDGIKDASSSSTEVTIGAVPKTVTANFTRQCTLTMQVTPKGAGTTTPAAGRTHTYDPCEPSVALEAFANPRFRFGSWDGAKSASANPTTIALKAGDNKTVTANFVPTSCTLTVRVSPSGGGTTTPAVGTYRYSPCRTSVELTATANPGYRFVRWYGASGTAAKTSVALKDGDRKIVTARFAKQCTLRATSSPGGTVSGGGTFDCYTWRLLRATVTTGSSFARWTGDLSGSANPKWIYLNTAKNVRAVFSCQVTVTAGAGGTVTGNGSPDCGTFWTVRAVHNDYHYLKRWIGDSRTSSSLRLYLVGNKTLRAVFDHVCNHPVYGVFCPVAGAEDESGSEP